MSTRRLAPADVQPDGFSFNAENAEWAKGQIAKFPEGRQASAIIPLLWRAQAQEGWLTRAAIEGIADMLEMPRIRALEVATFYFMFQLAPTGANAHIQVCGTTSCMICGAEDLAALCEKLIGPAHTVSADGKLSWEEVECLGACANAPMAQIDSWVKGGFHSDYYEDLTTGGLEKLIEAFRAGDYPRPGSEIGRFASEPAGGLTSLDADRTEPYNAAVAIAVSEGAA
jgi:NADH-quinone oxidoreductase subunit E